MDGESSVAAQVAAQSTDEQAAARASASAKSPRKRKSSLKLKHDLFTIYEVPISQLQIDAAEKAGASPGLLKRARGALAKQQEGDG